MTKKFLKKRGGGSGSNLVPSPPAKAPSPEIPKKNLSNMKWYILAVLILLLLSGLLVYYSDYLLCKIRGSGDDFCNANSYSIRENEKRNSRRGNNK
jgi:hypothetical protein